MSLTYYIDDKPFSYFISDGKIFNTYGEAITSTLPLDICK